MNPLVAAHRSLLPKVDPGSSSSSPIDAPGDGGPPAKRRCISSACLACRKRKSKCDGQLPACHSCTAVYHTQCEYNLDMDNRRKGALRKEIAELREELRAEVEPRNTILEALAKGSDADVDDIVQLLRSNPDYKSVARTTQWLRTSNGKGGPSEDIEGTLAEYSGKAITGKTGDVALYGHTSNLPSGPDENPPISEIAHLGTWTNITNDDDLIEDLLNGYLSWQHPTYMLFSKEIFLHGMRDRKLKYCTSLLVNSVLAVGCHFSDREEAKADVSDPSTLGDHFFGEAERLFRLDPRPCLTTTQALALMSIHLAMNSKDSPGWLYFCQSIGMAIELGLNKDQASLKDSKLTLSEIEARRITFWGLFYLQTAWAICVGRVSLLPRTAIRVERPNLLENLESQRWRPYGHSDLITNVPSPLEQRGFSYTILSQSGQLCELVDDIVQMFYAPRDRTTARKLLIYHGKLKAWLAALPQCLAIKVSAPTLPQVICLHMFYYNCKTHLFRPFVKLRMQNVSEQDQPMEICTTAANNISELLRLCVNTYGLKRVGFMYTHCVMTAAIIHLLNVAEKSKQMNQSETCLCEAIRALHQMKTSFPIVERYLRSIRSLTVEWFQQGAPQIVADILSEMNVGVSPISSNSSSYSTNNNPISDRKPSAPELVLEKELEEANSRSNGNFPHWNPFPQMPDGMPLGPIQNGGHMNISSMLAGEYPMLQRDGFSMGGNFDQDTSAWMNWDQNGRSVM